MEKRVHELAVIAHHLSAGGAQGLMTCQVFRIGNHIGGDTWELSPEADFEPLKVGNTTINGLGDGDTCPDALLSGDTVLLRAERTGTGNGRVYRVTFSATDGRGKL